jgi:hypothetical protein
MLGRENLRRAGLKKPRCRRDLPNGLKQIQGALLHAVHRGMRFFKTPGYRTLGSKMVDLLWLQSVHQGQTVHQAAQVML